MQNRSSLSTRPDLSTPRLLLRRPDHGDIAAIVGIVGNREVALRLARVPHPYVRADAEFFLERVVPAEWVWAITLHGARGLIGAVGLTPGNDAETAELGYWLSPAHWGAGIMTEAAQAVIGYGFATLELSCITSGCFEQNHASGRVLGKLGFVETGRTVRPCLASRREEPAIEVHLPKPRWAWANPGGPATAQPA